jgi:hypothetical protein
MAIFKSEPSIKIIRGKEIRTSDLVVTNNTEYQTNGESVVVIRDVEFSKVKLDHTTTDHITVKALTNVLLVADNKIDDDYDEIELSRGACVELRYINDKWYIMSSDGLKNS